MKSASLFLVLCLIATGFARPPVFFSYQDSLGQYSFGYSAPGSARSEVRTSDGATRGSYSYVDGTGVIQTAQYVADGVNGFRVTATNLPQAPLPVQDTPEVQAARTAHLQALEMAMRRDEEAHGQSESQENAPEMKMDGSRDANLDAMQEQSKAKSAEDPLKVGQQDGDAKSAGNIEPQEASGETLQAIATGKESEKNSQDIRVASIITPAATTPKNGETSSMAAMVSAAPMKTESHMQTANARAPIPANSPAAPLSVIPQNAAYSSVIRYVSSTPLLRYVVFL